VSGGGETFAGAAAIALGIVALCGVVPVTLVLVAPRRGIRRAPDRIRRRPRFDD